MAEKKVNRKRCVQVKLRLTPSERAVLEHDIKKSGLTQNDYLIQKLINRVGISAISCERIYCGSSVVISLKLGDQVVGYASCLYFDNLKKVQVSGFYVIKPFQDIGIEENLLQEILDYAALKEAKSVIAYPGTEPYCPTEWKPIDVQKKWYESQGFEFDHMVCNTTPCMIKALTNEVIT